MTEGSNFFTTIAEEVEKVIHGKNEQLHLILACWLAQGHVLLEDVPGTGKTVLARTLAKLFNVEFSRVQFTPDLLPSDLIGTTIYDENSKKFLFRKGPLFTTFFLADEINRATPRTQSALLESMAERQITIEKVTTSLSDLFFVIATQNPVEQYGTFPLPEAQLDRFAIKLSMGHPDFKNELKMLKQRSFSDPFNEIKPIFNLEYLEGIDSKIKNVSISDAVYKYILDIVTHTRNHSSLKMGASARASLFLCSCSQAYSWLAGNDYVRPQVVHTLAPYILGHRITLTAKSFFEGETTYNVVEQILSRIKAPLE